ncbi:hypothetical protein M438DRAFT_358093 [Aureobasidium pullulans EXF-150]|uniref:Uncharacterized protein n=1 Tax=Aureobasidium pullulans EXF-150 TaxID=1043002 RepID=A0A074X779_AURPU|nr:uncharacterized protein M438DRAFT_358093 [Aureobasidium pullulans EXF-150]KEQ81380.1 hypothetical protein M438DRAFT_358093 [Aureobasidium pullulans EXF-150]
MALVSRLTANLSEAYEPTRHKHQKKKPPNSPPLIKNSTKYNSQRTSPCRLFHGEKIAYTLHLLQTSLTRSPGLLPLLRSMFIRFLTPFRTKCLPDLREEATTSLPKVNLTADSDVVYINTTVTGGLICHQGLQDAHNLDTGVIYNDTTVTGTFMGHQIFEDAYNQVTSA